MTTDLREQLHAFGEWHEDVQAHVAVSEVIEKVRPVGTRPRLSPPIAVRRRPGRAVAVAVLATMLVIGLPLVFTTGDDRGGVDVGDAPGPPTPVESSDPEPDSDQPSGLHGLPPEGATPSSPATGELVASMWEHIGAPGSFGNGFLSVYADGRLIWAQFDPDPTGGWLERRLSPEGVELIRSVIIATGLFDANQPPPEPNNSFPRQTNGGSIQVRNGDQLVYVNRVIPELHEQLGQLWTWLPESAWEDAEAKAYVPSRWAVCLHSGGWAEPIDPAAYLSLLPMEAQELLAGARQLHLADLADIDPGFAGAPLLSEQSVAEGPTGYCFDITTEQARAFAAVLDDAGAEQQPQRPYDGSDVGYRLSGTEFEDSVSDWPDDVTLGIWPMLPHGVPAFTGA